MAFLGPLERRKLNQVIKIKLSFTCPSIKTMG